MEILKAHNIYHIYALSLTSFNYNSFPCPNALGKFKGGKSNLAKDHKAMLNPKELLALLRSSDHSGEVKNCREKGISDSDLQLLLDRSDLNAEQKKRSDELVKGSKVKEAQEDVSQGAQEMQMEA